MIRVLVVDDQAIVRDGLTTVLSLADDVEVVGEAGDGAQAVDLAAEIRPDVVLMDLRMPVLDGAAATARLVAASPESHVLVLTTYADDASIQAALAAGAVGYITKDAGRHEVLAAIRSAAAGHAVFAPEVAGRLVAGFAPPVSLRARFPALTQRETEVLELLSAGRTNPEIASSLFLTSSTVKSYVNQIFAKLGVATRAEAVALVRS